jgi:hypothetical protein
MTPEEMQEAARMRAAALRGQDPAEVLQEEALQMAREADVLSGVGGALSGLGGHSVRGMSQGLMQRGDALRDVALRRRALPKTPEELDAMVARAAKDRAVAANYGKVKPEKDTSFEDATDLRKEVTSLPETKAFQEVEANFHQLANAANTPTGDVSRIYALAKIYDPGGRVTQGDYDAAKQGQGPMARFQAYISEVEGNGFLSEQTRANMMAEAKTAFEKRKQDYSSVAARFTTIAKKRRLDPADVVIRGQPEAPPQPAGPPVPGGSGLTPEQRKKRMEEIRAKLGGAK